MSEVLAYRHAAFDSPWWANPNSRDGRFNRTLQSPTQYLCLHPMGPAAEILRQHVGQAGMPDADSVRLNLWAVLVDATELVDVGFDNCHEFGIAPEALVGDDYGPTQALADELRTQGTVGIRVPSAALPGTDNIVLFGARVLHPYLLEPITLQEVPTGHLTDGARPPEEVTPTVRWKGTPHSALEEWRKAGSYPLFEDPIATRW